LQAVEEKDNPEELDDGELTAPLKRLEQLENLQKPAPK